MDTNEVAQRLDITPRQLRVFLRSPFSTFKAVGSGARYDFTEKELPTIHKRFLEWKAAGKPKPDTSNSRATPAKVTSRSSAADKRLARDMEEWAEEGPVSLPDIRDPRVRRRVLADAEAAEHRLELQLLAVGMHITQLGDRNRTAAS